MSKSSINFLRQIEVLKSVFRSLCKRHYPQDKRYITLADLDSQETRIDDLIKHLPVTCVSECFRFRDPESCPLLRNV